MSDTPRTDEEVEIAKKFPATSHGLWVSAEFARQLERELSARPEVVPTGWRLVPEKATVLMLEVLAGPSAVGMVSFSHYQQWEKQWQKQWQRLLAECPATPSERELDMNKGK